MQHRLYGRSGSRTSFFKGYGAVGSYGGYGNKWKFCGIWYWKNRNLAEKLTVKALAEKVKQAFDLPFVLVYGEELMDMEVEKWHFVLELAEV